jgi:H+/Cl- antiporter ClcA
LSTSCTIVAKSSSHVGRAAGNPDLRVPRDRNHRPLPSSASASRAACAGAGAGIAATFNTPIGGVMFAIELMLPEISARTFLPVALATGTATFIGRIFFGIHPAFEVPVGLLTSQQPAPLLALLLYALLGG